MLRYRPSRSSPAGARLMNGPDMLGFATPSGYMGAEWHAAGVGDFNHDGNSDVLWLSDP